MFNDIETNLIASVGDIFKRAKQPVRFDGMLAVGLSAETALPESKFSDGDGTNWDYQNDSLYARPNMFRYGGYSG